MVWSVLVQGPVVLACRDLKESHEMKDLYPDTMPRPQELLSPSRVYVPESPRQSSAKPMDKREELGPSCHLPLHHLRFVLL